MDLAKVKFKMPLTPDYTVIQGNGYVAEIIRTSRITTASIKVVEGNVTVIVTENLPVEKIETLLTKKQKWIKEKLALQEQEIAVKPKELVSGECFSYLGRNYQLKVIEGSYPAIKFKQGKFVVSIMDTTQNNAPTIKQLLIKCCKEHAEIKLQEKTIRFSKIIGVNPISVGIKTFQSRWGSCSPIGDIHFNRKIIMAPN